MRTLYIDLDGVIAVYDINLFTSESGTPPFLQLGSHVFRTLPAYENVLRAVNHIYNKYKGSTEIGIKILTGIPVGLCQVEHTLDKYHWCDCRIDNFDADDLFCISIPKHEAVMESLWELTEDDILLDDYPKNLRNWREHGGTSVKCLNGINSYNPDYDYIETDWDTERIIEKFEKLLHPNKS
jgi:hypothetical protein